MAIVWYDISWNLNYLRIVSPEVVLHNTLEYSHATIFSGLCFKHTHSFRFPNSNRAVHDCCWMALVCQLLYSTTNYTHTVHECFVIKSFVFFCFFTATFTSKFWTSKNGHQPWPEVVRLIRACYGIYSGMYIIYI